MAEKAEKALRQMTDGRGLAFWANVLAVVLGAAGVIVMCYSSSINESYKLASLTMLAAGGVVAVALALVATWTSTKADYDGILGFVATIAAIVLTTLVVGQFINSRIILVSGLMSWNANNLVGWNVFYVSIAGIVCYVLADVALVVAAFLRPGRSVKK